MIYICEAKEFWKFVDHLQKSFTVLFVQAGSETSTAAMLDNFTILFLGPESNC